MNRGQKYLMSFASQVTLAEYIVLFPTHRPETILDRKPQITVQTITRDHRHMAYLVPGTTAGLYTVDLTNSKVTHLYQPVAATADVPEEALTDVSWSDDGTHLLLGSTLAGVHTVRLITLSDGSQVNLTDKYHFDFSTLQFSARDWRQMYWISPDGMRRLDAGAQTVTGILADKVSQFAIAGDRVLYVSSSDLGESLGSLDARDRKQTVIQALVKSPSYAIKYETYQGQDILAIVPSVDQIGTLYTNVFSNDITTKVVAHGVSGIVYSTDGHLATFYGANNYVSYDLEQSGLLARSVSYSATLPAGQAITGISYYDGAHLLINQSGRLIVTEYDGMNTIDLGPVVAGTIPYRLADQRAIIDTIIGTNFTAINSTSIK